MASPLASPFTTQSPGSLCLNDRVASALSLTSGMIWEGWRFLNHPSGEEGCGHTWPHSDALCAGGSLALNRISERLVHASVSCAQFVVILFFDLAQPPDYQKMGEIQN